jgi:hypothetical protein
MPRQSLPKVKLHHPKVTTSLPCGDTVRCTIRHERYRSKGRVHIRVTIGATNTGPAQRLPITSSASQRSGVPWQKVTHDGAIQRHTSNGQMI